MDGALVPELSKATGNTPLVPPETSIAPPPQLKGVDTTAPTDNHDCGPPEKKGHIAEGADEGRPKKELKNGKPISRTDPLPDAALNQPATLDPKEWPLFPEPDANPLTRRQRSARSIRPPISHTACFSFDTSILVISQGYALWKMIYAVKQGELVVQSLPSGNIMDLTGALTTPIKTLCNFDTQDGGNDMVYLGMSIITPNHHIHMTDGWMTASQAADKGQGETRRSKLERVYNLCLEGGGQYSHQHLTPGRSNDIHTSSNDGLPLFASIWLPAVQ